MLNNLLSNARLGRLASIEKFDAANAWPLAEYMAEVKRLIWNTPPGADAGCESTRAAARLRRAARRDRQSAGAAAPPRPAPRAAPAGPPRRRAPFLAPVNLAQSDLPALARAQLRAIQIAGPQRGDAATTSGAQGALE